MKKFNPTNFVVQAGHFASEDKVAQNLLNLFLDEERSAGYSVALNAEKIIRMYNDAEFRELVQNANLLIYDGVACKLWLRHWGAEIVKFMKKTDLPNVALELANARSVSVGVFAGLDSNKECLKDKLVVEYPGSRFEFVNHGYMSHDDMDQKLQRNPVQFCFLGLGSPRQEDVAAYLSKKHRYTMFFCVGGAFDIKLGLKNRAPQFIIDSNFEWLYRLVQQPGRARRYSKLVKFFYIISKFSVEVQR